MNQLIRYLMMSTNTSPASGWVVEQQVGTSGTSSAVSVAIDSQGNVYSVATMWRNISTGYDVFLSKIDSNGYLLWQVYLGAANFDGITDYSGPFVAVESGGGSVYVCGTYSSSSTLSDPLVAKFSSSGSLVWVASLAVSSASTLEFFSAIALDSSNNVYLSANNSLTNRQILVKMTSAGAITWQQEFSAGVSMIYGLTVDSSANVYVVGSTSTSKAYLCKLNTSGVIQWQRTLEGSVPNEYWKAVAVDSSLNVYVTGRTVLPTTVGNITVAKYNSTGTIQWQRTLSGVTAEGVSIALDSSANVYIMAQEYSVNPQSRGLMAKYNSTGTIQWQQSVDRSGGLPFEPYGIATNGTNLYVGSYLQSSSSAWGSATLKFSAVTPVTTGVNYGSYVFNGNWGGDNASTLTGATPTETVSTTTYTLSTPAGVAANTANIAISTTTIT